MYVIYTPWGSAYKCKEMMYYLLLRNTMRMTSSVCKVHLKERLEEYIKQWNGLVKLFRTEKREGLIQARSIGAMKATKGKVSNDLQLLPLIMCKYSSVNNMITF